MTRNYRDYVGPEHQYYEAGKRRFDELLARGLQEHHSILDVGCGSLRLGRLLIPFLLPGRYHGLEPGERWVREGLQHEVVDVFGERLVAHKQPRFEHNDRFEMGGFGRTFDFVVAFSVFIHCGKEQLETFLRNVKDVMHENTVLLLDINIGSEAFERGRHSKYPYASHQSTRYTADSAREVLLASGLQFAVVDERYSERKKKMRTLFELGLGGTGARPAQDGAAQDSTAQDRAGS